MPDDLDALLAAPDPARVYVADRIKRDGWGPFDALVWALDREAVERFRLCLMLVRLCADETARTDPTHKVLHDGYGVPGCPAGDALLTATQKSLGISDERARFLTTQLDQEMAALEGLAGSGG